MDKLVTTLITVVAGISAALLLYWVLNKIAELFPGRLGEKIKPILYILPAYAVVTVYLVYPGVLTVIYSFKTKVGFPTETWTGFDNYTTLLGNKAFQQTLFNTLLWIIVVPVVTVVLGLAIASLTDRLKPKSEKGVKTLIFMPMAISMVGAATVWGLIYDYRPAGRPQVGLQNAIVTALGFDPVAWLTVSDFRLNSFFLMAMLLWAQVGFSMVLLSAAIKGVPGDTLEAARIDGASERRLFFKIVVPQIKTTIITVFITTLIGTLKLFDIVYLMTNGSFNTNIVGNEFYVQFFTNSNQGAASAIVVMLMLAILPVMVYQIRNFRAEGAHA